MLRFSDIPPPLDDDKSKDVDDFDLQDEEIEVNRNLEQSEIPITDFDVYTSSSMKPPELSSALFFDTTPPPDDDFDPSKEISHDDSFDDDPDFHFHENNLSLDDEKVIETNKTIVNTGESGYSTNSDEVIKSDLSESINLEKIEDVNNFQIPDKNDEDDDHVKKNSIKNSLLTSSQLESSNHIHQSTTIQTEEPKEIENISSFSTPLAFNDGNGDDDDKSEGNLHKEFIDHDINYAKVIAFNEDSLSDKEDKINQTEIDKSDAFEANFNEITATDSVQDDDDDDDFNDFETAIPVHRHIEAQVSVHVETQHTQEEEEEIHFEADFSGFDAFSETIVKNFESCQDENDDDDDFGDFNDFTQAPTIPSSTQETHSIDYYVKSTDVNGLLTTMFPSNEQMRNDENEEKENANENLHTVMKSDDIVKKLDDFDETLALGYLYNNSTASQILVKALGIDTRNIVSKHSFK